MAVPTRPAQDGILDPAWGQWVHDEVLYRRLLGYAEVTANQGSIGASFGDITGLSLTLTIPANRVILVEADLEMSSTVAGTGSLRIVQDGSGAKAGESYMATANFAYSVRVTRIFRNVSGAHTWKIMGSVSAGTGTMLASATNPAFIAVTDLGPVNLP